MRKIATAFARVVCLIGGLMLAPLQVSAEDPTESWLPVENIPDCGMVSALAEFGKHPTWFGECENGKLNGPGSLSFIDDDFKITVEGTFEAGRPQGKVFLHAEGLNDPSQKSTLIFTYSDGVSGSAGGYIDPDGTRYEGEWKDTVPHGRGVMLHPDGRRYEGEFVDGEETGQGVLSFPDGTRYEGQFVGGYLAGSGKVIFSDDTYYEGVFEHNQIVGVAKKTFSDGSYYVGEFVDGAMTGHGVMHVNDRKSCEGEWLKDKLIGTGDALVDGEPRKCRTENHTVIFFE